MAHFYARMTGQAGEATRIGSKRSGVRASLETWGSRIAADLDHSERGDVGMIRIGTKHGPTRMVATFTNTDAIAAHIDDAAISDLLTEMHALSLRISLRARDLMESEG